MNRKMIFVLLLSGYIFTKPAATQSTVTTETPISPASTTSAIPRAESPNPGPAAPSPPGPYRKLPHDISQSVMVVIIFAVIAGVIGIVVGSAILIKLLLKRRQTQQSIELETSETPKQTEGTEDPEQQPMTDDSTIQASEELKDETPVV